MRCDEYGWHRDSLIEHIIEERATDTARRCFAPLVSTLHDLPPDHRLEVVAAITPWLAGETSGELPAALAALPVEPSARRDNTQWMIARAIAPLLEELGVDE